MNNADCAPPTAVSGEPIPRHLPDAALLQTLVTQAAARTPRAIALRHGERHLDYAGLQQAVRTCAAGLAELGLQRGDRVAIFLDKRIEAVVASFGAAAAGAVFVPINPLLRADQVAHILRDCGPRILLTTPERLDLLASVLGDVRGLHNVVVVATAGAAQAVRGLAVTTWDELLAAAPRSGHRVIDADLCAIFYTSGSTGRPKGVMLSHRNLVAGAGSVVDYLGNGPHDTLLAVLPLSFDAGFSQLTTAFRAGACVVLFTHLLPMDVARAMARHRVTGLTAVPPLFIQLCQSPWPADLAAEVGRHLRYLACTGGRMPRETLDALRTRLPRAQCFLMYGLTEAFRSTCLPPDELDRRPDSIGKAIPNAEILVLRDDGSVCAADEPGELVHRGALVAQGYWRDPAATAQRFRPLPAAAAGHRSLDEIAVFSGDIVRRDAEGFLYFVGRHDEMIKTSGYRVSPTEVEEVLYATQLVGECIAFGVEHPSLGQSIRVIATPPAGAAALDVDALLALCRARLPAYMVPAAIETMSGPLPRNPNGKIDRKSLSSAAAARCADAAARKA